MIDVLVVGGGPAGLSTALYAVSAGLRVVVLEPRATPGDKACGEGLMPGVVRALGDLGVDPPGHPLAGIAYLDGGSRRVEARFRGRPGRGVRRPTLQEHLLQAAAGAGIPVLHRRVEQVSQDGRSVAAAGLRARYLVAADGLHSPIRSSLGLSLPDKRPKRYGLRRHFATPPWSDLVEVHWSAGAEAYVTPVSPDLVGVAILTHERGRFEDHLRHFPSLAARLPASAATATRGAGPLRQRVRARSAGRVLLVGDASGYVDAITGEGIAVAMATARAAVACVAGDCPQRYEAAWQRASRGPRMMTESLLWARRRPLLGQGIVRAAASLPGVFSRAVEQLAG